MTILQQRYKNKTSRF